MHASQSWRELVESHQWRVGNLEGVVGKAFPPALKAGPVLSFEEDAFASVARWVNVFGLANNHCCDCGEEGLVATMSSIEVHGGRSFGAGTNMEEAWRPLDLESCRIVAVAEHEFGKAEDRRFGIATTESELRLFDTIREGAQSGRQVIVYAHGGSEMLPFPPPYLRERYRLWIRLGARAVVGHHPHVAQGFEYYEGGLICYSLGNAFFPHPRWVSNRLAMASLAVSFDPGRDSFSVFPIYADYHGNIGLARPETLASEILRSNELISDQVALSERYCEASARLFENWYRDFLPRDPRHAARLLHYFRCDAHRAMVAQALSQRMGETKEPLEYAMRQSGDFWSLDKDSNERNARDSSETLSGDSVFEQVARRFESEGRLRMASFPFEEDDVLEDSQHAIVLCEAREKPSVVSKIPGLWIQRKDDLWEWINAPYKVEIGANRMVPGWCRTNRDTLDAASIDSWRSSFSEEGVSRILAEHVLEHLEDEDLAKCLVCASIFLKPGGVFRIAVPDAAHPSAFYRELCKPEGSDPGSEDHKQFFDLGFMIKVASRAGFQVEPLEWWSSEGFHKAKWANDWETGRIERSSDHYAGRLRYSHDLWAKLVDTTPANLRQEYSTHGVSFTSLVVDLRKPE
ncbi:CapA family protein [Pelagicoccus sp. SDUM812003]|uniref:CapA family protein n=1 Tax=Pelagicoccus sp. SDUM812003 TaxID=3041267 RepID=UPI00280DD3A2|nr:CapA family protein [Pelagicoccus sp. SDUM812003]MDQ8201565.1 CapA family protein [Pelagicoccus sp. SDUM812003]